jgi:hypothetical protein
MSFSITKPKNGSKFQLSEAVEFSGTTDEQIERIELFADEQFVLPTVTVNAESWSVANRFNLEGRRKITAKAFDHANIPIATVEVDVEIQGIDFGKLVPIPVNINQGVTKAKQSTMLEIFGKPGQLSADCTPITNPKIKRLLVTANVGPFNVTGVTPAVDALKRIFTKVRLNEPALFQVLGTAGMLCCRRIRSLPGKPPSKNFSNHSWGSAIDMKIKGTLDPRGNGTTQLGLLKLHPFFNEEKFFWGAGFKGETEDSMHFEASDELIRDWKMRGLLNI